MSNIYRFMLQWNDDTADKVQAGNILKSVGRHKSKLVVAAVAEYIKEHPDSLKAGYRFKSSAEPPLTRSEVEGIVRDTINARLANIAHRVRNRASSDNPDTVSEGEIDII